MGRRSYLIATGLAVSILSLSRGALSQGEFYRPTESPAELAQASVYYQRAVAAFRANDDNACLALCKAATQTSHGDKNIIHLMALAYARSGDNYNAMMMFRSALTLDYNFVTCRNNFGLFYKKTGKTDDAKRMFEECIKIKPTYPDAYYHLGEILKERGDLDGAIENFQTATRLNPRYVDAQKDLGLAIYERYSSGQGGDISTSIEKLQTAAKLMPQNPIIHYHLGCIYCADARLDDAEAEFRSALGRDVKCAPAHWELARVRYYRGDPNRCLDEIRAAAAINPLYTEEKKWPQLDLLAMKIMAAKCYEAESRYENAVDAWKDVSGMQRNNAETAKKISELEKAARSNYKHKGKGAVQDPEEIAALIRKGLTQVDDGDLNGGKNTFQHALELDPQSFDATQNLGAVLEATGDLNGASVKYQAAMALVPKFEGLYYNMAYVLEKMNLSADAGLMYQKFHELAGRYPYDPRHIVALQQEDARERARAEQVRHRGY